MENSELNDFLLNDFLKNRKVVVFSYGNIYQTETSFKIAIILKTIDSEESEYSVSYINLKEIIAFPLGTVIENQKRTGDFAGIKTDIRIDLNSKNIEKKILLHIPILSKFIDDSNVPDKIKKFNSKFHIKGQWYYVFKDEYSQRNIYIPHYEVARKFFFTSPAMTRQILSASLQEKSSVLKGLYKSIEDIDTYVKEITLTQNANTNDAPNIYRFATNETAFKSWHQIRCNLTASSIKIKKQFEDRGFSSNGNEMKLNVDFPVSEIIDMHVRVKELDDGSLLVLKVLEEDTSYDFDKLFIKIERKDNTDEPVGVINREGSNKLTGKITNKKPTDNRGSVEIKVPLEEREKKLGLEGKEIIKTIVKSDENKEYISIESEETDDEVDLSFNESDNDGDDKTAPSNTNNEEVEENEDDTEYLTLEDFKHMLYYCAQEHNNFSYTILIEDFLPQKPEEDKRRKWKKSKLLNGNKRKYLAVNITYKKRNITLIEIERDSLVKGLSTLIIFTKDNETFDTDLIVQIGKNFVYENGRWLKNFEPVFFKKDFLGHPKGENRDSLKDWYERLINKNYPGFIK